MKPRGMHPSQKLILADLKFGGATARDLVPVVNICIETIRYTLRKLHKKKLIRITSWEQGKGGATPVWGLANGFPDAPKPKPLTRTQMDLRWQAKNPEAHKRIQDNYEQRRKAKRANERATRQFGRAFQERQEGSRQAP